MRWTLRHGVLDFSSAPVVMGVLNVTPDSFSDGGLHLAAADAVGRAGAMVAEGAGIIDVGAESTRPGSAGVADDEQIARITNVIRGIRERHASVPISIDTQSAAVAARAIELGADIINDVSALRSDVAMADLARETETPVVLMHMRGQPGTMQEKLGEDAYGDVVTDVADFLRERVVWAESAKGLGRDRLAIDPGIGFGKTARHNLAILRNLGRFVESGLPVVVGASRKRFIGSICDRSSPDRRTAGSVACAVAAVLAGVQVVRAHDVRETVDAVRVAAAIRGAG